MGRAYPVMVDSRQKHLQKPEMPLPKRGSCKIGRSSAFFSLPSVRSYACSIAASYTFFDSYLTLFQLKKAPGRVVVRLRAISQLVQYITLTSSYGAYSAENVRSLRAGAVGQDEKSLNRVFLMGYN